MENTLCRTVSLQKEENCLSFGKKFKAGSEYTSDLSENEFEEFVRTAKEYILNGDIFQVVISKQCAVPYDGYPFKIYRQMRRLNPSPYMYFMDFSDKQVIGASPEMLIKVEGREVTSVPIAGTRKRGKDAREDSELEKELLADKKECAEHLMLVDISRNDIGRVCKYGSVREPGSCRLKNSPMFSTSYQPLRESFRTTRLHLMPSCRVFLPVPSLERQKYASCRSSTNLNLHPVGCMPGQSATSDLTEIWILRSLSEPLW